MWSRFSFEGYKNLGCGEMKDRTSKPPWRNRLARSAVNRKVGGSSPPGGGKSFFLVIYPVICNFRQFGFVSPHRNGTRRTLARPTWTTTWSWRGTAWTGTCCTTIWWQTLKWLFENYFLKKENLLFYLDWCRLVEAKRGLQGQVPERRQLAEGNWYEIYQLLLH